MSHTFRSNGYSSTQSRSLIQSLSNPIIQQFLQELRSNERQQSIQRISHDVSHHISQKTPDPLFAISGSFVMFPLKMPMVHILN